MPVAGLDGPALRPWAEARGSAARRVRLEPVAPPYDRQADPRALDGARRQIAAAELDIVFYPDIGMEALTYFLAFARLAPVQCVTWGHPVTTGIPALDHFVSSELLEPDGAESHYAERLVRLPRLPACVARPARPSAHGDRDHLGLGPGRLYVCPQSLFKLHPDFDDVLGEFAVAAGEAAHLFA